MWRASTQAMDVYVCWCWSYQFRKSGAICVNKSTSKSFVVSYGRYVGCITGWTIAMQMHMRPHKSTYVDHIGVPLCIWTTLLLTFGWSLFNKWIMVVIYASRESYSYGLFFVFAFLFSRMLLLYMCIVVHLLESSVLLYVDKVARISCILWIV